MVNSKELFLDFIDKITITDSREESESIAFTVFESLLSLSRTDILMAQGVPLSGEQSQQLDEIINRINEDEPVQYIIGESWFLNRRFTVNSAVLIPRPETEELVMLVVKEYGDSFFNLLDIGTGTGCIPVSIKLACPNATVMATDISLEALQVAKQNAKTLAADITFIHHDILTQDIPFEAVDVIVSNPPYVLECESGSLHERVIRYEPHLALFTPDKDPLKFYQVIAAKGYAVLSAGGKIFVEINQQFGEEVANLFADTGFESIKIIKDLAGNNRFVTGLKR